MSNTEPKAFHPALLTVIGVILVALTVAVDALWQDNERYGAWYMATGVPGVFLIVWNLPRWLKDCRQTSRS